MELDITPHDSTVVTLNADQKAVVLKKIREIASGVSFLGQFVEADTLEIGNGLNILRVAEYLLSDISKLTGIETDSATERERRYAKLREANMRIRELERQLGESAGTPHVQMGLKDFAEKLNSWWSLEGFGHISDIRFTAYGTCEVDFSCMLFGRFPILNSETPLTDKEQKIAWRKSLQERGFVLCDDPDDDDHLKDCDATRDTLCRLISSRMPSAKVVEFTNHSSRRGGFNLRGAKVFIHNLTDIAQLPQMPQEKL